MNTRIRLVICSCLFFIVSLGRGQVWDGRVSVDTAQQVAVQTDYPVAAVSLFIPSATITNVVEGASGVTLAGSNLEGTVTIGAPSLAQYDVTWKYSADKMADGSGFVIFQDTTTKLTLATQSTPIQTRRIVLDPQGFYAKFKNRQYAMYMALYSSQWFYDWISRNLMSPLFTSTVWLYPGPDYSIYTNTLTPYTETITLGPLIILPPPPGG